ncbi:uncharacterized protein LOC124373690 [Homalodisca vitripennis]|uniref:uncharacterized protein LOC124373690 n=1 Tax=Homalodisca vitripennis TaxID=197043 RepID=UPI001EECAD27|nr:uncharacterized protein LOC124373690 [Homalodisca vitripennis]
MADRVIVGGYIWQCAETDRKTKVGRAGLGQSGHSGRRPLVLAFEIEQITTMLRIIQDENSKLKKGNAELRSAVSNLEVRVRSIEQYSRKQNIEIDGISETQREDIYAVLNDVGKAIGVELKKEKVVAAHRVPTFNKKSMPPRFLLVVRFTSYDEKDEWINGFKRVRPLMADKINPNFNSSTRVFVNEHVSPENKQLLSKTKEAAREKNYKYVWSRDGRIFVRRSEGEKCKRIDLSSDLEKL